MTARNPAPRITRLRLTDFRSYPALDCAFGSDLVALAGPNGAGKTNILEAISLFAPGRGLRRAPLANLPRRSGSGGFAVLADVLDNGTTRLLASAMVPGSAHREARIDREPVASANRFLEHLALLWLTPDQDGLFRGAAGDRRRFLDRLVLAVDPGHGTRAHAYEQAMRQRNRLLDEAFPDSRWLDALEQEVAELGVALVAARLETVRRLAALAEERTAEMAPFPHAGLSLAGELEAEVAATPAAQAEDWFRRALHDGRSRDRAAGRTLVGPQMADLVVIHGPKAEPAHLCSTGEQKALLIGLVLAQARLVTQMTGRAPILLLDEIAAHLDEARRGALYRILTGMGAQAFMTGTDAALFEGIGAAGVCYAIAEGHVQHA